MSLTEPPSGCCATRAGHGSRQIGRTGRGAHWDYWRVRASGATLAGERPGRIVWHEIACAICGNTRMMTGNEYHSRQTETCGRPQCSKALRLQRDPATNKIARLTAAVVQREKAKAESPLVGSFETNVSAREWHLLSPDGTAYHFRNLALWLQTHTDLFEDDDVRQVPQSRTGVTTRAQSQLGRLRPERLARRDSWKGWRWLGKDVDDD